jgi:hypothetical protein
MAIVGYFQRKPIRRMCSANNTNALAAFEEQAPKNPMSTLHSTANQTAAV